MRITAAETALFLYLWEKGSMTRMSITGMAQGYVVNLTMLDPSACDKTVRLWKLPVLF